MIIDVKRNAEQITVEVTGRLDTTTSPALEKELGDVIEGAKELIFDMKNLEYISSAGLRVLLGAQKKMQHTGIMKLKNVSEEVMEVFEITGFSEILMIE